MIILTEKEIENRKDAQILVLPFYQEDKKVKRAFKNFSNLEEDFLKPIELKDFYAKDEELLFLYPEKNLEKRIVLLGFGKIEDIDLEKVRRSVASLVNILKKKKIKTVNFVIPEFKNLEIMDILDPILDSFYLTNYTFNNLLGLKDKVEKLEEITFIGVNNIENLLLKKKKMAEGVYFARDLINENADTLTSEKMGKTAKSLEKISKKISVKVLDKKDIEKEKMGLLLAVNKGSTIDPTFSIISYKGNPDSDDVTVFVGKGITYDTGGLSLKPSASMVDMKTDMSGAGVLLGTMLSIAKMDLKVNVTAVIPSTDNAIGPNSYKPGDVYKSINGKTVEVTNTDAEGRLILADALAYAEKYLKPTRMIDIATLTGAVGIALGDDISGVFTNDENLFEMLEESSKKTSEFIWRMPLYKDYLESLKSSIADIQNSSKRVGSLIMSALFLQEFVEKTPWAHLDIAGTNFIEKERHYYPVKGTANGVRLLIDFIESLAV